MTIERQLCWLRTIRIPVVLLAAGLLIVWTLLGAHTRLALADQAENKLMVMAWVNDEPITESEFLELIKARHKDRNVQSAKSMDFRGLLENIISDRLIVQEGIRMGLDQEPDVVRKLELREKSRAADLLYLREVRKRVNITEEEVRAYFEKIFEQVHPRQIVVKTSEEAEAVLTELQGGADFAELARERSIGYLAKDGGDLGRFPRYNIFPPLEEAVFALKAGETSQPIRAPDGFHIVKLEERIPADPEKWPLYREKVEARFRRLKENELYAALVSRLREGARITIHKERLDAIKREDVLKKENRVDPKGPVAEVEGSPIPMGFYLKNLKTEMQQKTVSEENFPGVKERVLNYLVDRVLMRKEAERRKLSDDPLVFKLVEALRNRLVKQKFTKLVILPQITRSEEALGAYYAEHQDRYRLPDKIRLARLTVSSKEKATELSQRLKAGADFTWVVKRESEDPEDLKNKGGDMGWTVGSRLMPPIWKAVSGLPIGGLSEPVHIDTSYQLYYVKDKKGGLVAPFDTVKGRVSRDYYRAQVASAFSQWDDKLRAVSTIKVNEDRLKVYERKPKRK